ncbi:tRNA 2'-phosphotransferase 1 [Elysia marginata]|uniref:2'-phosphotransferase n=1 Tax=Elysia marginata TaxID=1093978 RepID=A0AAV4GLD9_9GAST|nr:tRNA 2'-phosphotransferase 1 [Elysia marginata]
MIKVSKTLSYLLRHNAEKEGFTLLPGGYLYVDDILSNRKFHTVVTKEDIQAIVETSDKKRFTLVQDEENQRWKICANQGHSIQVDDLDLRPLENTEEFPIVVHGTYHKYWNCIAQQGLSRMNRNHMHFAAGLPGHDGVISGMRSSCQVIIYLDLKKALEGGLKFFVSANNVILSPGNESGVIETQYFFKVVDRRTGKKVLTY